MATVVLVQLRDFMGVASESQGNKVSQQTPCSSDSEEASNRNSLLETCEENLDLVKPKTRDYGLSSQRSSSFQSRTHVVLLMNNTREAML